MLLAEKRQALWQSFPEMEIVFLTTYYLKSKRVAHAEFVRSKHIYQGTLRPRRLLDRGHIQT